MNKKLLDLIDKYFDEELSTRTNWGRNQIKEAYKNSVIKACAELLDEKEKSE